MDGRKANGEREMEGGRKVLRVDIAGHQVQLDYDEAAVSLDQVKEILAEEDYPVESIA